MTLPSGTRLGTYEVVELLGSGGMGDVYRARDLKLGREVAIKVLPEEFARDAGRVTRFEREARMLAAVNHAAIAAIYGAEEDGAIRYIVMELVEGDTLAERLSSGRIPVPDALRIALQVAEALEVAHDKGVIHRDLKPANIKVTPENRVKVLDFGLAKAMERPYAGDTSRTPTLVMGDSRPGDIVGTPEFMSPEQARGKETDRRTDIWAFGCLLYEMLSGKRAFTGETVPDAMAAILHHDPDWSVLPPRVPERVRELLRKCLEKDVGRRLRDAGDARLEIESALAEMSTSGAGPAPRVASPAGRKLAVALLVAAALALAIFLLFRSGPAPVPSGVRQLAVLPFRNLTGTAQGDLMGLAMVDTVSARLANVPGLQVVTPRAAIEAASPDASVSSVARRLGADTVLSGSLQRENDQYRITYWLVDQKGNRIAANTIDGAELFPLQDRLAAGVVHDLRLRPVARRTTPTPSGLESASQQERYLQAIGLLARYDKRDSVEQAQKILEALAAERPRSPLVQAALGRAALAMYDFTKESAWADRALASADAAGALDPESSEVEVVRGETLLQTGRIPESTAAFRRALAQRPGSVDAQLGLGRALEAAGDNAGSETAFRRAIALQPSFAVFNQLGGFYADRSRWSEAAEMFRRAVQAAPDSYRAYSNLGGTLVLDCNFPDALDAFRKAQKLAPKDVFIASNLGLTQLWTGHPKEALEVLEVAARSAPDDFQIWGNYGDALAENGLRDRAREAYEKSIALARQALTVNPVNGDALSFAATGLARVGRFVEAAEPMAKALAADQKESFVYTDAGVVAALSGRRADALGWLRKAVDAGYCRQIIARMPEFATLRETAEFQAIVAPSRKATAS
jgi:tetratricopeptide (TPR) repeat protein/TolB-like protein